MAIKYTIGKKISSGFGILTILTVLIFIATYVTLNKSSKLNNKISQVYFPSVELLEELDLMLVSSKAHITTWIYVQSRDDISDKQALRKTINEDYPEIKKKLEKIAANWSEENRKELETCKRNDFLFIRVKGVN